MDACLLDVVEEGCFAFDVLAHSPWAIKTLKMGCVCEKGPYWVADRVGGRWVVGLMAGVRAG